MKTPRSIFRRSRTKITARARRARCIVVGSLLAAVGLAVADQAYWTGAAGSAWNAGLANWNTTIAGGTAVSALPGVGTDVFFTTTRPVALNLSNTLGADTTINSLNFTPGSGAVTIGAGNTLTINAGLAVAGGAAARTINAPVLLGGAQTWTNNGAFGVTTLAVGGTINRAAPGGQLTVGGQGNTSITGAVGSNLSGGIIKTGTGRLTLGSASNAFTGGLAINGGVVEIASDGALGNVANGVTLGAGGTLRFGTAVPLNAARVITVNGTALNPSGIDLGEFVTQIIGAGQLTGSGSAKVSLTGGTFPGTLAVDGANPGFTGNLTVGAQGQLVGHLFSRRTVDTGIGATLLLQNAGTLPNAAGITVNNASFLSITQPATAVTGRLGSTMPLTFHSGQFRYSPSANGGIAINETFGNVTIDGLLAINGGSAGPATGTTLNFGTLTRDDHATVLLLSNAPGTGSIGGGVNTGVRYFFSGLADSGGTAGAPSRGVVPWAAATNSVASSDPNNLVTYDTNGFRTLTASEVTVVTTSGQFSTAVGATPKQNVNLQASLSIFGTVNSLLGTSLAGITLTGASTFVNNSGAVANTSGITFNGPTLSFPNGAYFHLGHFVAINGTSTISGTGGVTASSLGSNTDNQQLRLANTIANTFTGGLFINGNSGVTFTANNQLGRDGSALHAGDITLSGGQLLYSPASGVPASLNDGASSRAIKVNASNGTIGTTIGGATLQIPGVISGTGQVQFGGGKVSDAAGVVELTNPAANTYSGGSLISTGILRLSNANQLGTGPVLLNGGTLQASGNLVVANSTTLVANSTIDTQASNVTFTDGLHGSGGTSGTVATTLLVTKNGTGALTVAGTSTYAGGITLPALSGALTISGNGRMPDLGAVTIGRGGSFNVNDSATPLTGRVGPATNLTLSNNGATGGATLNLTTNAAGSSFEFGTLTVSGGAAGNVNSSVINLLDGGAGNHTVSFLSLGSIGTNNSLMFSGTANFGGLGTAGTRVFFGTAPTLVTGSIPNATFTGSGGSGQATYDATRGVILFLPTAVSGNLLDNIATSDVNATNTLPVPTTNSFTTTGIYVGATNPSARAKTGATINTLILDGADLTLINGYAAQAGNASAANGTLAVGFQITSQNGAKTIFAEAGTTSPTIAFGSSTARFTTNSDLTVASPITLSGSLGLIKNGAGTLTINGTYAVTGALTQNAGTLTMPASITSLSSGLILNGGTFSAAALTSLAGLTYTSGTLNTPALTTIAGALTTHGSFSLPPVASVTGAVTVNAGVLTTTAAISTGALTVIAGGTLNTNGNNLTAGATTGTGNLSTAGGHASLGDLTGSLTIATGAGNFSAGSLGGNSAITAGGAIAVTGTSSATFGGTITGGTTFTKSGSSTQTLSPSAPLNYSGTTTIAAGTLRLGASNALPATTALTVGAPADGASTLFDLNNVNQTLSGITVVAGNGGATRVSVGTGSLTLNGNLAFVDNTTAPGTEAFGTIAGSTGINGNTGGSIDLGGAIRTFTIEGQDETIDLAITARIINGGVVFIGLNSSAVPTSVATMSMRVVNTYSLGTTVAQGVLNASTFTNSLPANGPIVLGTANSAEFGAINIFTSQTVGTLSLATGNSGGASNVIGSTSASTQTLTIDSASNATFAGSIGGTIFLRSTPTAGNKVSLVKQGAGTQTLAGPNPYIGTTTVSGGKLLISGSITGTTAVTVSGGTLELGASNVINDAATMSLTGGTLATGGFSETVGALTLGGAAVLDLGSGASLLHFADSSVPTWTGTLSITNWSGLGGVGGGGGTDQLFFGASASGLIASQTARITFLNPAGFPAGTYPSLMLSSGELVAVPEPGPGALLLAGLGLLGARRRRRPYFTNRASSPAASRESAPSPDCW